MDGSDVAATVDELLMLVKWFCDVRLMDIEVNRFVVLICGYVVGVVMVLGSTWHSSLLHHQRFK